MKFKINTITIKKLIRLIDEDSIDLKPYYQRNDIWTRGDQESLIDSIKKNYPLPSFFIYRNENGILEMVDGQQRARTIYRYTKKKITDSKKNVFNLEEDFLEYELSITELFDIKDKAELEEFYVLVNKKGKQLNTPEIYKAEYANTNFLKLTENVLEYQNFMNLNLFTDATSKRMNDRSFVEELIAYLKYGIQDKKKIISDIYDKDITNSELVELKCRFFKVIDRISLLNNIKEISKTRYRQKNDFYTLFNFVNENIELEDDLLKKQYLILLTIAPYISPSNEDCFSLREYAINCVSQSNSRSARIYRIEFFNSILLNKSDKIEENKILSDIAEYIDSNQLFDVEFERVNDYYLMKV